MLPMKHWYTIKASATPDVADVNVFDDIGGWGINAKQFLSDLKATSASTIRLFINSPGGSVFDAVTMFNGLRMSGKRIEVTVLGVAASAASFLALAGDTVTMPENTFMFLHNPISGVYGNAEDMRDMADALDKVGTSITAMYAKRWKGTDAELADVLAAETYLTAAECLERGLCDTVTDPMQVQAAFDVDRLPENVRAVFEARRTDPPAPAEPLPTPTTVPFANRIKAAADAAGLGEFAAHFAMDASLTTDEQVRAALTDAGEVQALCAIAGLTDRAAPLIKARTTLAAARTELCEVLAAADEARHVDTAARAGQQGRADPKNQLDPAAIYAKANAKTQRSK